MERCSDAVLNSKAQLGSKRKAEDQSETETPTKTPKAAQRAKARQRTKELLKEAKALKKGQSSATSAAVPPPPAPAPVPRSAGAARTAKKIPDGEFKKIMAVHYSGDRRCNFYNSSLGCKVTKCKWKHKCVECNADHPYIGNH